MPRVALCFFGLVKDASHTAASVEQYVLKPLRTAGYRCNFFCATYNTQQYSNQRNKEQAATVRPRSIERYSPLVVSYSDPAAADAIHPLSFYLQHGDGWPDNPRETMRYYARQLASLKAVTALWTGFGTAFDLVIYLRPDTRFVTPLPLVAFRESEIVIPSFHSFGGYNDRFAYGSAKAMALYGRRFDYLPTFFQQRSEALHAETYLKLFMDASQLKPVLVRFPFIRIRADERECPADVLEVKR